MNKHSYFISIIALICFGILNSGCSIAYIAESAYYQIKLLNSREPIEEVLKDANISEEKKTKLRLAQSAQEFSVNNMGLKKSDNYSSYVELDRKYVTYVVSAAPKNKLEHYTWWFPIVGSVPYKGYFYKEGAKELHEELIKEGLDVHTRGVSAYSTLGWFNDPLLSSMMRYSDYSLVNTIIHENVHATIYISSSANFNERLATFLGNVGAELYFKKNYPNSSEILEDVENRKHDEMIFSKFISQEIEDLKVWYEKRAGTIIDESERRDRLNQINKNYISKAKPNLKTKRYNYFERLKLNNAILMQYKLYVSDLSDFEKMFDLLGRDLAKFIEFCKSLEDVDKPSKVLKERIKSQSTI